MKNKEFTNPQSYKNMWVIVVVVHITHIQNTSRHWETKKIMKTLDNAQGELYNTREFQP